MGEMWRQLLNSLWKSHISIRARTQWHLKPDFSRHCCYTCRCTDGNCSVTDLLHSWLGNNGTKLNIVVLCFNTYTAKHLNVSSHLSTKRFQLKSMMFILFILQKSTVFIFPMFVLCSENFGAFGWHTCEKIWSCFVNWHKMFWSIFGARRECLLECNLSVTLIKICAECKEIQIYSQVMAQNCTVTYSWDSGKCTYFEKL
jgi:hypothetical protein